MNQPVIEENILQRFDFLLGSPREDMQKYSQKINKNIRIFLHFSKKKKIFNKSTIPGQEIFENILKNPKPLSP